MVNLKQKPFNLKDEDILWVENTLKSMTTEEKIGQLFFNLCATDNEDYLKMVVNKYHVGGIRYNNLTSERVLRQNNFVQKNSKIPVLVACNTENGGNGACNDGTMIGDHVKIGATNDLNLAYLFGQAANKEASAIGCNASFAPVCDINLNWRNPIISNRCFSSDAEVVRDMSVQYLKGAMSNKNFTCFAKHFPGDGLDERDQHLAPSVNSYDVDKWMDTFGKVYQGLIDEGLPGIMAGHILSPAWSKHFNPALKDEEILPATLSKELLVDLLRGKLGFNGVIVTDASHMIGMTCFMKRSEMLPRSIAAGCDMFLFFNDLEEDYNYMLDGYKAGIITEERLNEAVTRILGMKASISLHKDDLIKDEAKLKDVIKCQEHLDLAKTVAKKAITLVKNKEDIFPITPEKYKKIMIVPVGSGAASGLFALLMGKSNMGATYLKEALEKKGFEVEIFVEPIGKIIKEIQEAEIMARINNQPELVDEIKGKSMSLYFAAKSAVKDFVEKQDLIITLANVKSYGQVVERVSWGMGKGGGEIPWYVYELPVIGASIGHPFLLSDAPQLRNYINCYDGSQDTIESLVEKLTGNEEFTGVDQVNAFGDIWGTNL